MMQMYWFGVLLSLLFISAGNSSELYVDMLLSCDDVGRGMFSSCISSIKLGCILYTASITSFLDLLYGARDISTHCK